MKRQSFKYKKIVFFLAKLGQHSADRIRMDTIRKIFIKCSYTFYDQIWQAVKKRLHFVEVINPTNSERTYTLFRSKEAQINSG